MEKLADERRQMNVVAVPLLGFHGHVNPMLSFCRTLTANSCRHGSARDVHVTLIVTKHWLNAVQAKAGSHGVRLSFIEVEADGMDGLDADDKEESLERLLDTGLEQPPDLIIADSFVNWAVAIGQRRNIPVASFWPASASAFSVAYHRHLIVSSHHFPLDPLSGEERINLIPGIPSIRLADLPGEIQVNDKWMLNFVTEAVSSATKAQFIIFRTTNELEEAALAALKIAISPDAVPLYAIGPAIPFNSATDTSTNEDHSYYMNWLDTQETNSVLYISLGTCRPTSDAQFDELAIGVRVSGVPFLWVARERASHLSEIVGDKGKVVSWCDQMRVLRHSSIGGFVTHCGWNSTLEAAFAGVPALAFPLGLDQTLNSKLMVEDWGIGFRVKSSFQDLVTRDQISELLKKFMDSESEERKELDENCKKFRERLLLGVAQDGSTGDLHEFLYTIALPSVIRTN